MIRISRIYEKRWMQDAATADRKLKFLFTWIFFVSEHPRIIRIVSIEKELEIK
jgi:hypothetical protein